MGEKRCPCGFPRSVCWRCSGPDLVCEKVSAKVQAIPPGFTSKIPQSNQALAEQKRDRPPESDRIVVVDSLSPWYPKPSLATYSAIAALGGAIGFVLGWLAR